MDILFLGDSITDCGHCFTRDNLGNGYVKKLSLLPGVTAVNGGADGFTFPDVLRKWRLMYAQDTYSCVVITCGINDVGLIADLKEAGREADASAFLHDSLSALRGLLSGLTGFWISREPSSGEPAVPEPPRPDAPPAPCRILLLEPFLFPFPKARAAWFPILEEVRASIQETISRFCAECTAEHAAGQRRDPASVPAPGAPLIQYVPTQAALDALAAQNGYPAVTADGIHPTDAGHECLAQLIQAALSAR